MAQTPAFPGAEGHGRYVTGGRGGKVVHVTNLNDSGTGSFREAVKTGKRIIVFDVAGVIALKSDLKIGDNITILGQTAPSPGITLRYYTVQPGNNNIIRFLRIRRGEEKNINDGADATWQRNKTGIIFDHCSFSWSIDEVASFYDNNNFTMQWCTVAESLTNPGHSKGAHGYGGIWGGKLASFHHNFVGHLMNRGPRFNGARYGWTGYTSNKDYDTYQWKNTVQAENVDFRNCVMYNAQGTCYGGPGGGQINIVNNYYKAGPSHSLKSTTLNGLKVSVSSGKERGNQDRITQVTVSTSGNSDKNHPEFYGMTSRYFINGNTTETTKGSVTKNKDWKGVIYDDGTYTIDKPFGEEGYSISFTVPEGSTEITPVGTASNGYYAFYVSSQYYVSLYTAGGYSEFDGTKEEGDVWFYSYLNDYDGNQVGEGGYDEFTWSEGDDIPEGCKEELRTVAELVSLIGMRKSFYGHGNNVSRL